MMKWNQRKTIKRMTNGIVYKSRPKQKEYILVQGLHEPLVSKEIWEIANKKSSSKEGKSVKRDLTVQNPLVGLVECGYCHRTMQRRNYRSGHIDGLICPLPHCKNIGSHLYLVENAILEALKLNIKQYKKIIKDYKRESVQQDFYENNVTLIEKEIEKTKLQLNRSYDLLEQGIYDNNTFLERSKALKEKIKNLDHEKEKYSYEEQKKNIKNIDNVIPKLENVINSYSTMLTAEEKNKLLKTIIKRVYYTKKVRGKGHEADFELKIDIKI